MGNLLVSQANVDAERLDSSGSAASSVAPKPRSKPPSAASVASAAAAGIDHADAPRSDVPTRPEEVWDAIGEEGRAFVDKCFRGLNCDQLIDVHCHIAGVGTNGSGCYVNRKMHAPLRHPLVVIKKKFFLAACGVDGNEPDCDLKFAEVLANLRRHCTHTHEANHGKSMILAFDAFHTEDGMVDPERTGIHVPNEWVWQLAAAFPETFVPVASVHPYRKDAVEQLELWASKGARMIKWLPNAMGINPSSPLCTRYYAAMRRLGLILLTHTGVEHSIDFAFHDDELGNPILLRAPLDAGVRVIAAHCASEGNCSICGHEAQEVTDGHEESDEHEHADRNADAHAAKRHKLSDADDEEDEHKGESTSSPTKAAAAPASAPAASSSSSWLSRVFSFGSGSKSTSSSNAVRASPSSSPHTSSRKRKSSAPAAPTPCSHPVHSASLPHRTLGHAPPPAPQQRPPVKLDNFELFIQLMDVKKYEGLLFGDISSVCAHKRVGVLETLLNRQDLHHRLIDGSDYPVPAVSVVIWTSQIRRKGLITRDEERLLNLIFDYNPLLFDFCLKRCLRSSQGKGFLDCVFQKHAIFKGLPTVGLDHGGDAQEHHAAAQERSSSRKSSPKIAAASSGASSSHHAAALSQDLQGTVFDLGNADADSASPVRHTQPRASPQKKRGKAAAPDPDDDEEAEAEEQAEDIDAASP